jgi:hypothetical protein
VIASSSTVLANLSYLIGAVVLAFIAGLAIWLRHRRPRSVDANMASFRRGLEALAPDEFPRSVPGPAATRVRPVPSSPNVRLERPSGDAAGAHHHREGGGPG